MFTGISTDHCVNTMVRMAGNFGFATAIVADACHTFDRQALDGGVIAAAMVHDVHLASLASEFASVRTTVQLVETMAGAD